MVLGKDASIIADSTMSSSPMADASPMIKRATRTYGRRREEPLAEGTADSTWYATPSLENIHKTAPPGMKETIPASSPAKMPMDLDAFDATMRDDNAERRHNVAQKDSHSLESDLQSDQEATLPKFMPARREALMEIDKLASEEEVDFEHENALPKHTYFWREKMVEIDKDNSTSPSDKSKDPVSFGQATLLQETNCGTIQPVTFALTLPPSVSDDIFNGPPSTLSRLDSPQSPFSLSSPSVHPHRSRRSKRQVVRDSDSEEELQKGSSSTAPSTSEHNSFLSVKSRSSSTQPTSDEDVPSKISMNPRLPHSRKPNSSRVSVPPLGFTELASKDRKRIRKSKQKKIKAPTKKELRETAKDRSRLAAQTNAAVPRAEVSSKYTVENFLKTVYGQPSRSQVSDPIEPFTSPIAEELANPNPIPLSPPTRAEIPHLLDDPDSDNELPEITELLREDARKRHAEELKKMKQRALEQQTAIALQDSEDDDLVISTDPKTTIKEEEENRRSKPKRSTARKTVAQLAHINPAAQAKKLSVLSPNRIRNDFPSIIQDVAVSGSSANLQRVMFAHVQEHAFRELRRKEEEWTKHGGHLAEKPVAPAESFECAVKAIAGKGLEIVKANKSNRVDEQSDDDDDDDDEWRPETRGSASPVTTQGQNDDSGTQENMLIDADITMVAEEENADDSDIDNTKVHNSRRNLVLSDSDDESPIFRRSPTSGLATEDEYDKENNTKLMYDQGEDKENKRVVRHQTVPKGYTIFDVTAVLSSPESSPRNFGLDGVNPTTRRPFQELLSEESPKAKLFAASGSTQTFVSKLQQASPLASALAPAPTLRPFLPEGSGFAGFSQAEPEPFGAALLQPGFSELFESGTEKRKLPLNLANDPFEESISDENHSSTKLKRVNTLDLTQDVAAAIQLQPAFQADDSLVRKAEAIFEKEQAFVIEANTRKIARQRTELYVNELGFLTQTRPLDGTPEVYHRVSPASATQTETPSQRMPLQTLSLSSPSQFESPRQEPLRRLRRVIDTPLRAVRPPIASPQVQPMRRLDAHEELRRGQQALRRKEEKKRKRAELGILFEDEAAESDDDDMFGFMIKRPADEEEEGEDLDQNLPALMDDRKMDADTEAVDLVLDKYKEHLEEDDKKLEELHQAAIQGQLRQKRNRGVGIDDSDDDSDVDDNERARRAMKRARKSDRNDIKGLEANEETRAFADSYNQCLRDDDDEDFAFLEKQFDVGDVVAGHDDGDGDDSVEDEEIPGESVDVSEIHKTVKERAREGRLDEGTIDSEDVSWLEQDEDMEDVPRVKNVNTRQARKSRPDISDLETGVSYRKSPTGMNQMSKQWFTEESKTRNASTARKNGGLAVTGHRKREKVTKGQSSSSGTSSAQVKQVRAAASALSVIADKSSNFA